MFETEVSSLKQGMEDLQAKQDNILETMENIKTFILNMSGGDGGGGGGGRRMEALPSSE